MATNKEILEQYVKEYFPQDYDKRGSPDTMHFFKQKTLNILLDKAREDERVKVSSEIKYHMIVLGEPIDDVFEKYLKPEPILSCDAHACMYCKKPIKEGNCCEACMKKILKKKVKE